MGTNVRALALDIGEVRCGIAATDISGTLASPICVLPTQDVLNNAPSWRRILEDYEPDVLVSGLPTSLSGENEAQAKRIREQAEAISQVCGIPLDFVDERLTSAEARRILREQGLSEREMRGKVDMVAASLFLEAWLEARKGD